MKMQKWDFTGGGKTTFSWGNYGRKTYSKATEEKEIYSFSHLSMLERSLISKNKNRRFSAAMTLYY